MIYDKEISSLVDINQQQAVLIKQITAERDAYKDLLEQAKWHVLSEDISLAAEIDGALASIEEAA